MALVCMVVGLDVAAQEASAALGQGVLLDVPYVSQSEALCGGAAVSMVLRYWGERSVRAEDFAHLVGDPERGIAARDLAGAVRDRGWQAHPFSGDSATLVRQLERGRPVILLLRVRPQRYHYVVLAGRADGRWLVHDPAEAPDRWLDPAELERRWAPARRYALLVLPPEGAGEGSAPEGGALEDRVPQGGAEGRPAPASGRASAVATDSARPRDLPAPDSVATADSVAVGAPARCQRSLERGIAAAREFRLEAATTALERARACGHPEAARELAGVWLRAARPEDAVEPARAAVRLDPGDVHAARTLGAALYMTDRPKTALAAWNRAGEPRVDLVQVLGLSRTRHRVVETLLALEPGVLLTPGRLARSGRRLEALPAALAARVGYRPVPGGRAEVEAAVLERPLLPTGPLRLAAMAGRAALQREVTLALSSPTGGGELLAVGGRWWESRPRVSLSLAAPGPLGGAVWEVSGFWERQAYAGEVRDALREERARAGLEVRRWSSGTLGWRAGASLDRFRTGGTDWLPAPAARVGLTLRPPADRFSLSLEAEGWAPVDAPDEAGEAFARVDADVAWRSRTAREGVVLSLRTEATLASGAAPRALWPGAGVGHARDALARAHPLLDGEGVLDGLLFGRRLAAAMAEVTRWWTFPGAPAPAGLALFADVAVAGGRAPRAGDAPDPGSAEAVDLGLGLRVALPGASELRVDAATGLLDGADALSAGFRAPWPGG